MSFQKSLSFESSASKIGIRMNSRLRYWKFLAASVKLMG